MNSNLTSLALYIHVVSEWLPSVGNGKLVFRLSVCLLVFYFGLSIYCMRLRLRVCVCVSLLLLPSECVVQSGMVRRSCLSTLVNCDGPTIFQRCV